MQGSKGRNQKIIKKNEKKHDEIAFLAKINLDCMKDFASYNVATNSCIGPDYFLVIDMLRKYDDMKE